MVGCNRNPETGLVEALDTWNVASPGRQNQLDLHQDVTLFQGNYTDLFGYISCTYVSTHGLTNDSNLHLLYIV